MKLLDPTGAITVENPCWAAGRPEVTVHRIVAGLKPTEPTTMKLSGALVPEGVVTVTLYVVDTTSVLGTTPTMKISCQSELAKLIAAEATTEPVDASRKSTE